ncbi:hypothetical protein DP032_07960 [Escherichia coli]|nr:hypothetical protein [Escherichia coli]EFO2151920.1 hypothetical protein [Escherichia coli]EGD4445795.1 hypothetical protein [Escherichia coli]RBX03442.1 hypothetical protein DS969_10420 [Escherichia coli]RBX17230.1 hypothetical protein DS980_10410 [Escherichia coli]
MMTSFIITLSFYKAPSSGGAFPFQPPADSPIVDERRTPRNAFPEAVLPSPSGHAKGCNDLSICSFLRNADIKNPRLFGPGMFIVENLFYVFCDGSC